MQAHTLNQCVPRNRKRSRSHKHTWTCTFSSIGWGFMSLNSLGLEGGRERGRAITRPGHGWMTLPPSQCPALPRTPLSYTFTLLSSDKTWLIIRAVAVTILPPNWRSRVMKAVIFQATIKITEIRFLQTLMLLMVISSLPNLLTDWYSALYIHSNVIENLIKHFMRAHELMLHSNSIGYAIERENRVISIKKRRVPSRLPSRTAV